VLSHTKVDPVLLAKSTPLSQNDVALLYTTTFVPAVGSYFQYNTINAVSKQGNAVVPTDASCLHLTMAFVDWSRCWCGHWTRPWSEPWKV